MIKKINSIETCSHPFMTSIDLSLFHADVLALAASINELTNHTRRARTAMWCALQMSSRDVALSTLHLRPSELAARDLASSLAVDQTYTTETQHTPSSGVTQATVCAETKKDEASGTPKEDVGKGADDNNNAKGGETKVDEKVVAQATKAM